MTGRGLVSFVLLIRTGIFPRLPSTYTFLVRTPGFRGVLRFSAHMPVLMRMDSSKGAAHVVCFRSMITSAPRLKPRGTAARARSHERIPERGACGYNEMARSKTFAAEPRRTARKRIVKTPSRGATRLRDVPSQGATAAPSNPNGRPRRIVLLAIRLKGDNLGEKSIPPFQDAVFSGELEHAGKRWRRTPFPGLHPRLGGQVTLRSMANRRHLASTSPSQSGDQHCVDERTG